ncbi:uncharacterized protein SPSK_10487 [Sporothrix schenckii 1099-18]|uniref:Uncharacterized protein n=1 Tax=Sporothrix schenckii 1099-18 TaxID=1397361 RepID=A0A0F2MBJ4_SPOSC|nr:uncharacterized protein SPSK_10487 [Sporothrix schenckii 1099-18]KJR86210.1 hypothetical protein SPSK_10487 [Sporothrix schenckii 1099-18]
MEPNRIKSSGPIRKSSGHWPESYAAPESLDRSMQSGKHDAITACVTRAAAGELETDMCLSTIVRDAVRRCIEAQASNSLNGDEFVGKGRRQDA